MKRLALLFVVLASGSARADADPSFAGEWETTFGRMTLTVKGTDVTGFYDFQGNRCPIKGVVAGTKLTFTYEEPDAKGAGWFELAKDGKSFAGKWRPDGVPGWEEWSGTRAGGGAAAALPFAGLWQTSFGMMRLYGDGKTFRGMYGAGGAATLEGKVEGKRLVFRYQEPTARGEGWFELSGDGKTFNGSWLEEGKKRWADWTGKRVEPVANRRWLVVLEANWENGLREKEYAFGAMLRAFFARSDQVQVRHRFFTDAASLTRWCRDTAYLAEPVVLVIASHGTPQGVSVGGKTVGARELAEGLKHCDNVQLLHFSACLLLKDGFAAELSRALAGGASFPVSGYRTSVDWAGSAVIEFTYLDMILMRGIKPAAAAEQLGKLLPFSGDRPIPGAAIQAAGFRFVPPTARIAEK